MRSLKAVAVVRFLILLGFAVVTLFPIVWVVTSSFKPLEQVLVIPVQWLPNPIQPQNYPDAWFSGDFTQNLLNSVIVMVSQIVISVSLASLAGFGFAKYDFPLKGLLFLFVLSMTLLPLQVIMIPLFIIVKQLGWIDTYQGLIVPTAVSAFGVFFMRQFIATIPNEYVDAARVDGASELGIFWRIMLPMCKPALVTLALLVGLASWDEFLWPLIVVSNQQLATLPLGIMYLKGLYQFPVHHLLAVAVVMLLPPLIAFIFAQKQIIESTARTGLKG